jgi:hypothetical protein
MLAESGSVESEARRWSHETGRVHSPGTPLSTCTPRLSKRSPDPIEEFSLSLHPDKTRLIEFGRYAADRRARAGLGKPETFKFLARLRLRPPSHLQ